MIVYLVLLVIWPVVIVGVKTFERGLSPVLEALVGQPPPLRVRDQAREAVVLVAFSAATASALALGLLLLTHLGSQG